MPCMYRKRRGKFPDDFESHVFEQRNIFPISLLCACVKANRAFACVFFLFAKSRNVLCVYQEMWCIVPNTLNPFTLPPPPPHNPSPTLPFSLSLSPSSSSPPTLPPTPPPPPPQTSPPSPLPPPLSSKKLCAERGDASPQLAELQKQIERFDARTTHCEVLFLRDFLKTNGLDLHPMRREFTTNARRHSGCGRLGQRPELPSSGFLGVGRRAHRQSTPSLAHCDLKMKLSKMTEILT